MEPNQIKSDAAPAFLGFLGTACVSVCTLNNSINAECWDGVSRVHLESLVAAASPVAPRCSLCQGSMYLLISVDCTLSELVEEKLIPQNAASGFQRSSINDSVPHYTRILHLYWCPYSDTCSSAAATDSRRFALHRRLIPSQPAPDDPDDVPSAQIQEETPKAVFGGWGAAPASNTNLFGSSNDIHSEDNEEDDDLERMLALRDAALSSAVSDKAFAAAAGPATPADSSSTTNGVTSDSLSGALSDLSIDFESESAFTTPSQRQRSPKEAKNPLDRDDSESNAAWSEEGYESVSVADKFVYRFSKRVAVAPEQVLRWQWHGIPLLLDAVPPSAAPPPHCERCEAPRRFEMQLMPSFSFLLREPLSAHHIASPESKRLLKDLLPQLELGTVLCYTCANDCAPSPSASNHAQDHVLHEFCVLQFEKDS
eukprot:TRINITY_DN1_c0_g2_i1.p1 TRINITY_DN1_c0_g2~~TRINITY_DN1_c0_g2_i1.p1  ORF type:complete len:426 (+),score=67.24 TRINITY_DN1_c0_g2_i1:36-1313(+)